MIGKADLPAFALALRRVRRSLGGGGKVRLYVRQTVAGAGPKRPALRTDSRYRG